MKSFSQKLLSLFVVTLSSFVLLPEAGHTQQLWFSPGDDLNVKGVVAHPDFMQLFTDPQSWPKGSAHVDVLQLRAPWFLRMPDSVTQPVLSFIKQHHMALAVPLGFVTS